jgi:outer membrane protein OmpA-like peptidoglycan-associated protein
MRRVLSLSTALVSGLSLAVPVPVWAQDTANPEAAAPELICEDGSALPCPEGIRAIPKPAATEGEAGEPAPEAPAEAPAEQPAVEAVTAPEAPAAEAPAAEAPAAEAPAEKQPAAEAPAAEAPTEAPAAEVPAAEQPAAEAPAAEAPATEAPAAEAPAAEAPAEAAPAESAPATEAAPAAEAAPEAAPEGTQPAAEPALEAAPAAPEAAAPAPAAAPETLPDTTTPDAGAVEAAAGAAPAAAAISETAAPTGAAVEETVTEDTARSSAEDFANKVGEAAPAAKKKGMSDLEKALVLGAGALIIGGIISNNRKVELNSGDRVVVTRQDGSYEILKDDDTLLRQPGATVRTETFSDGSTRSTVTRPDGSQIVTIRDAELRVLRRVHIGPDGRETVLIDDTQGAEAVDISTLPAPARQPSIDSASDEVALRAALSREAGFDRRFSLAQIRQIEPVRALVPEIELNTIVFETGSAAILPDQARALSGLGNLIRSYIDENPREVFLIEGHTDAVGSAASNLALSDRRAESVALALTEYFAVPPENLVVQGYGEAFLKVPTLAGERANRRAAVRRITDLLQQAAN